MGRKRHTAEQVISKLRIAEIERRVIFRTCVSLKPLCRLLIITLIARRLTSHFQSPGSVSSKSFRSNTRFRSGGGGDRTRVAKFATNCRVMV
jgi:hypothetical protein